MKEKNKDKKVVLFKRDAPKSTPKEIKRSDIIKRREAIKSANKTSVSQRLKNHPNWSLRMIYRVGHGVWVVVMAVGGFIAWLIATLFI